MAPRIRPFRPKDAQACFDIFTAAVHRGTAAFYSPEERAAWAPRDTMPESWPEKLSSQITLIATAHRRPVGFMTLGRDGHIDLAYVAPDHMGRGVGDALYRAVVAEARTLGLTHLDTAASHLARRFFEKHGWQVDARQSVIRQGVALTNYRMSHRLDDDTVDAARN